MLKKLGQRKLPVRGGLDVLNISFSQCMWLLDFPPYIGKCSE